MPSYSSSSDVLKSVTTLSAQLSAQLSTQELVQAKQTLRKEIRAKRRAITRYQQANAAEKLLMHLKSQVSYRTSRSVAVYLANDGEIRCDAVIRDLQCAGKRVYLPVLHPINRRQLFFIRYDQHTPMRYNRFGIQEPKLSRSRMIAPERLDLILMPLVAFDEMGNRLGMGGGFYDTTFEKMVTQCWRKSPVRTGVAHNCQQVHSLPKEPWDIPIHSVITPTKVFSFCSTMTHQ